MTDFEWTKSQFYVPEGMIYLDGNSLGPLPLNAKDRVGASMTDQWGENVDHRLEQGGVDGYAAPRW